MNAPSKLGRAAFDKAIADHIAEHYEMAASDGSGQARYLCKTCGGEVMQTTAWISVHTLLFEECSGSGEVRRIPLPYCPKCEGKPTQTSGCVHI